MREKGTERQSQRAESETETETARDAVRERQRQLQDRYVCKKRTSRRQEALIKDTEND